MGWVEILPGYTSQFRQLGWESAEHFLSWTGILVNQHRHRQVEQVAIPSGQTFFLKKELNVTWRDRFQNAWHGFGWCSTAVREGATLQALRDAGIGSPEVVALGESGRRAFVVTRDESAMSELRALLPTLHHHEDRHRLAVALGRELAQMHDAGFDHPDLFAKHILAEKESAGFRFCILDWQRSRRRRAVSWRVRCRDLAILDATLHGELASDHLRMRFLHAYQRASAIRNALPLRKLAGQIRQGARRLSAHRNIREIAQPWVASADQQFVSFENGRLLVVRSFAELAETPLGKRLSALAASDGPAGEAAKIIAWASGMEDLHIHSSMVEGFSREMPALAHTLFRLHRFGVPAPRLIAVAFAPSHVHVVARGMPAVPLERAIAKAAFGQRCRMLRQAGAIIRQIHEAGYRLPDGEEWSRRLGVVPSTGAVTLARVEPILRGYASLQEFAPVELNRQRLRLSRCEQLRFLSGYLRRPRRRELLNEKASARKVVERLARS